MPIQLRPKQSDLPQQTESETPPPADQSFFAAVTGDASPAAAAEPQGESQAPQPVAPPSPHLAPEQPQAPQAPAPEQLQPQAPVPDPASVAAPAQETVAPAEWWRNAQQVQPQVPNQMPYPGMTAPAQPQIDPAEVWDDWEEELVDHYGLSEEEADEITSNPGEHIPRMLARMHREATQQGMALSQAIAQQVSQQTFHRNVENINLIDSFYKRWPDLREPLQGDPSKAQTVMQMYSVYRQQYPQMGPQQMIEHLGAQAHVAFGIQPTSMQQQQPAEAQLTRIPPHQPAGTAQARGPAPVQVSNEFMEMAEEALAEDG